MLQPITTEQTFVSSLEKFLKEADKFVRRYYSGSAEDSDLTKIFAHVSDLASDADTARLELEHELIQETKDLLLDHYDSSWV